LLEAIGAQLPGVRLADGDAPMQRARMVKLDEEITLVEEACAIADSVTLRAIEATRAGVRENEVAGDAMRTL
jgi:Xaa-Pro aminopeptidase